MGLLYNTLHGLDDEGSDFDNNIDEETLKIINDPIRLPESLLTEIGNISRRQQQEWEDRYHSSKRNSSRNSIREKSREYIPDTGWTRDPAFVDRVGGPIKIEREANHDVVLVYYPGQPMWGGQGWPMYTPDGTRAMSAYWNEGVLYVQLNNGRIMRCWGPHSSILE